MAGFADSVNLLFKISADSTSAQKEIKAAANTAIEEQRKVSAEAARTAQSALAQAIQAKAAGAANAEQLASNARNLLAHASSLEGELKASEQAAVSLGRSIAGIANPNTVSVISQLVQHITGIGTGSKTASQGLNSLIGSLVGAGGNLGNAAQGAQQFAQAAGQAGAGAAQLGAGAATASSGLAAMLGPAALVVGGIAAIAAAAGIAGKSLLDLANTGGEFGQTLYNAQLKTGLTADNIQTIAFAADLSKTSLDQAVVSINLFTKELGKAAEHVPSAMASVKRVGLDADTAYKDLNGSLIQVFNTISSLPEGSTKQLLLLKELFGRNGDEATKFLHLIKSAGGDFEKFREELRQTGFLLSGDELKAANDYEQSLGKLKYQAEILVTQVAEAYMPQLKRAFKSIGDFLTENKATFVEWGTDVGKVLSTVATLMYPVVQGLSYLIKSGFHPGDSSTTPPVRSIGDSKYGPDPSPTPTPNTPLRPGEVNNNSPFMPKLPGDPGYDKSADIPDETLTKQIAEDNKKQLASNQRQGEARVKIAKSVNDQLERENERQAKRDEKTADQAYAVSVRLINNTRDVTIKAAQDAIRDVNAAKAVGAADDVKVTEVTEKAKADIIEANNKHQVDLEAARDKRDDARLEKLQKQNKKAEEDQAETNRKADELAKSRVAQNQQTPTAAATERIARENEYHDLVMKHRQAELAIAVSPAAKQQIQDEIDLLNRKQETAKVEQQATVVSATNDQNSKNRAELDKELERRAAVNKTLDEEGKGDVALLEAQKAGVDEIEKAQEKADKDARDRDKAYLQYKLDQLQILRNATVSGTDEYNNLSQEIDLTTSEKNLNAQKARLEEIKKIIKAHQDEQKEQEETNRLVLEQLRVEKEIADLKGAAELNNLQRRVDDPRLNTAEQLDTALRLRKTLLDNIERQRTDEIAIAEQERKDALAKEKNLDAESEKVKAINKLYKDRVDAANAKAGGKTQDTHDQYDPTVDQKKIDNSGGGFLGGVLQGAGIGAETLHKKLEPLKTIGNIIGGQFNQIASAVGNAVHAFVLYGNAGTSVRKVTAEILASIAEQSAVQAVYEVAQGLAMLALSFFGVPTAGPSATAHFAAAAEYGLIAGVATVAGRGVAGNAFANQTATGNSSANGNIDLRNSTTGANNNSNNNGSNSNGAGAAYSSLADRNATDENRLYGGVRGGGTQVIEHRHVLEIKSNDSHIVKITKDNINNRGDLHSLIFKVANA